jgi:hypothetical protein
VGLVLARARDAVLAAVQVAGAVEEAAINPVLAREATVFAPSVGIHNPIRWGSVASIQPVPSVGQR